MSARIEELLARIAEGVEKMASDPVIEYESGPPLCPHCGELDPTVLLPYQEPGSGPLSEIVIQAECTHCGKRMIAVVESYSMHKSVESAMSEVQARRNSNENL